MIVIKSKDIHPHADFYRTVELENGSRYYLNFFFRQERILKMLWGQS